MIDFHTHILPGIDDGSPNVDESVALLQTELEQGVDTVFLTPHYYAEENSPVSFLKKRYHAWRTLEPFVSPELPKLRLGAEVQYFEGICAVEDVFHLRIVGTDYLLLEMPFQTWSDRMIGDVLELNDRRGMQIVLAHIERYMAMQKPKVWEVLRAGGVLMQSNVSFFASWKTRRKAVEMLKQGHIHFLGSDCHNMKTRSPNWDQLPEVVETSWKLSAGYHALRKLKMDGIHIQIV